MKDSVGPITEYFSFHFSFANVLDLYVKCAGNRKTLYFHISYRKSQYVKVSWFIYTLVFALPVTSRSDICRQTCLIQPPL